MERVDDPSVAYALMQEYFKNLRIKKKDIYGRVSPYTSSTASENLLKRIRENMILCGPKLWINLGYNVFLLENSEKSCLDLYEELRFNPNVTYLLALTGNYSIFYFQKGASILKNAICIIPSYPEKKSILDIKLSEKGKIERDNYPFGWDEIDWEIYHAMRDPTRSFGKVAGELKIRWETARRHYQKISKQCKIWISFFPLGFKSYRQAFLTFETDYEMNLIEELQKIDRTSFLFKFDSTIALMLYYTDYKEIKKFEYLKKEKKIKNFKYSTPLAWKDHF